MGTTKFLKAAQEAKDRYHRKSESTPPPAEEGEGNWLISYADMMTLLCGFFIMLFSMAKMDEPKYEQVKEVLAKQFGGQYESPTQNLAKYMSEVIEAADVKSQAVVKSDGQGVSVAFESTLFFDTLSAEVKPEGRAVLDRLAKKLYEKQQKDGKAYQIVVEGHTDPRPITAGTFPSNWELSGARASRIVRFFLDNHFSPDRMTSIGYADTRPEVNPRGADGSFDEALLAKNRRVVLRILRPEAVSIPMPSNDTIQVVEGPAPRMPAAVAKPAAPRQ
jgi:chemotaxis protein MotB